MAMRSLQGKAALVCRCIAVSMSLFHLYTAAFGTVVALLQRSIHLAFAISLVFLLNPARKDKKEETGIPFTDVALALLAATSFLYVSYNYEIIRTRLTMVDALTPFDFFFGLCAILLVMEGARRTLGLALVIIPSVALLYAYFGDYMPGALWHRGFSPTQIIDYLYLGLSGIFGMPVGISATFLMLFIIFGCIMEKTGTGQIIINLACALAGKSRGGPAKVSVIASALFGSVSGTAVSNVYATGTFTIPLMKRLGYRPEFAAGVEAVSSTGGQLVPPVLGAAAFIMAEWLGVPYATICLAAIIPAFLLFLSVLLTVHLEAAKTGMAGLSAEELPDKRMVIRNLHLLSPLVVLMGTLLAGFSISRSVVYAMVAAVALSFLRAETRLNLEKVIWILETAARRGATMAMATASAGIIIGVVTLTGIGLSLTGVIISYFQDNLLFALFFAMVASIILGIGVPTVVAYIIVATLTAPILTKLGVPPLHAHMFVYYYAIIALITPPVAVAAWAGAEIAGADYNKTSFVAVRLGIAAFIVPFMFIYGPALLGEGDFLTIMHGLLSASLGVSCLACALAGWMFKEIPMWQRVPLFAAGLGLVYPGLVTDLLGLGVFLSIAAMQLAGRKNSDSNPEY